MCPASTARVSELLVNWGQGDQDAREALIPLVYGELCPPLRKPAERPGRHARMYWTKPQMFILFYRRKRPLVAGTSGQAD